MTMPTLDLTGLAVAYGGVRAVKDLTLTVAPGEIVALLGANGAGKSTTLNTVSGLLRPAAGTVTYDGVDLATRSAAQIVALGITHVPEGRRIFGALSVHENLQLGGYTVPGREADRRIKQVYELLPLLADRRRQSGGTLSGGEQQLLAIGRALVAEPRLLMLDEPSMGLAPRMVRVVFDVIRAVNERGTSVLIVEQNARAALRLAHRAYVLDVGRLTLSGPAAELRRDPKVVDAYLGA
jgi:branched-chain amino acid transport system ATP-binding protein